MPLVRFTVNLDGTSRRETLHGRKYIVKPSAIGAETVMNGSEGPGLYPAKEWAESVPTWDHKPLVYTHPKENGKFTSACDPAVLETSQLGLILNTKFDDKLRTEAWFDEELTKNVDNDLYDLLDANVPLECSTGVKLKKVKETGVHNDMKYRWKAKDLKGDHLAVMAAGSKGAYSVPMGGGIGVMNELVALNKRYTKRERRAMAKEGKAMRDGSLPIANGDDLQHAVRAIGRHKHPALAKKHIVKRARDIGLMSSLPTEWQLASNVYLAANELSLSDVSMKVREALVNKFAKPGQYWYGYICEVYEDRVVFENGSKLWEMNYSVKDDGVKLKGDQAREVKKVYQSVEGGDSLTANAGEDSNNDKETKMAFKKAEHIAGLIGNGWTDADKGWLESLPDDKLEKIKPEKTTTAGVQNGAGAGVNNGAQNVTTASTPAVSGDSGAKAASKLTLDDVIANTAEKDPSAARMLRRVSNMYTRQRGKMIEGIKARTKRYPDAVLANMDDEVLEATFDLLNEGSRSESGGEYGNFFGQNGVVVGNVTHNGEREEPLGTPSMHADDEVAAK